MSDSLLIVGGGIAGVQAALDAAESGANVYLVERFSSLGGNMAKLDKTFPTNDCSMCILSPKLVEVGRHPRIHVLTLSQLEAVEGRAGNFKVKIKRHPRYVKEDVCTGCGSCATVCPITIENEFEEGLGKVKAISIPFPQSVPLKYTINPNACLRLIHGKGCGLCAKACTAEAIDFEMKEAIMEITVGSIIIATGFEQWSPLPLKNYNYDRLQDVITSLEFERILNASGPTGGKVVRPSDGRIPEHIVFVQCVGSRDERYQPYCSRICCMATVKEAMMAFEHEPSIKKVTVLYMDIRAYGKDFEAFYRRARCDDGIEFIRARPGEIFEENGRLTVRFENFRKNSIEEINADLVVLASSLVPSKGTDKIAKICGIALDRYGFIQEKHINALPVETSREGIFLAGCAGGPKDIPDTVAQASAAAAKALKYVEISSESNEKNIAHIDPIPWEGELRIGVFVCSCGLNIGGVVDVDAVAEYAFTLSGVVHAESNIYTCSADTQQKMAETIREKRLNRVVVAACSPRTHEPLFRETCKNAGLNPYLMEMTNIREQDAWIHRAEPEKATEKAKDLVRMAVAKARWDQPLESDEIAVRKKALVIGGGIAGMQSAIDLSDYGFGVTILEKSPFLGGRVAQLGEVYPEGAGAHEVLSYMYSQIRKRNIRVITGGEIHKVEGYIGNFNVTIKEKFQGVDASQCTLCGKCSEVCPVVVPDEFNRGLTSRKAVYINPNSWPESYVIDYEHCTRCWKCREACPTGAIGVFSFPDTLEATEELKVGTIILAMGADIYTPKFGEFGYGEVPGVITNIELERILATGDYSHLKNHKESPKNAAFILCVGSRQLNEENADCSRYCCQASIKQAIQLKKMGIQVKIFYRDIRTIGKYGEKMHREANEMGIQFLKYVNNLRPKVFERNGKVVIQAYEELIGEVLEEEFDLVVLAVGMRPREPETGEVLRILKVPRCCSGFCMEKHVKLAPLETNIEGIYLAGCLQSPKGIAETLAQASGAALKAAIPMLAGKVWAQAMTAVVDEEKCRGCGSCVDICEYGAPSLIRIENGKVVSRINSALCKGCGACAPSCCNGAIRSEHFTHEQIMAEIEAYLGVVE